MININEVPKEVKELYKKLPKFPGTQRIDYHHSDVAPVVTIFVQCGGRILLMRRSDKVRTYRGKWNAVAGYLDTLEPLKDQIYEELREEIGIKPQDVESIKLGEKYTFRDEKIGLTWITYPVLVKLAKKPKIKLEEEHTQFKWIKPEEIKNFDIVPKIDLALSRLL